MTGSSPLGPGTPRTVNEYGVTRLKGRPGDLGDRVERCVWLDLVDGCIDAYNSGKCKERDQQYFFHEPTAGNSNRGSGQWGNVETVLV